MVTIRLNASEIAVITGHNKYQDINELRDKILIRNGLQKGVLIKTDIQKKLVNITDKVILQNIKKELKLDVTATKKEIEKKINDICITPQLNKKTEKESHNQLDTALNNLPIVKELLKKSAYSDLIKARGTKNESKALNKVEMITKLRIQKRNDTLYQRELYNDEVCKIILQGKIDGMINNDTVVESKNRSRRLFYKIPEYEKVQLEAYLYLTKTGKALHIENYDKITNESYYYHNEDFWSQCKQTIIDYITQELVTFIH